MDIQVMKLALKVAEFKSFRQAADEMDMPTSKASRMIATLEYEHGHTLFKRTTRRMQVTEQGEVFLRYAKIITEQFDRMKYEARELSKGRSGSVLLGYSAYTALDALPAILLGMSEQYPGIDVRPKLAWTSQNHRDVQTGSLDAALVMGPMPAGNVSSIKLFDNRVGLMVSAKHPLARKQVASFRDLKDECFLVGRESRYRVTIEKLNTYFAKHSATPKIGKHLDDSIALEGLVRAGLGIALSIESVSAARKSGLALLDIADLTETIPVSMIWLDKMPSPALATLIKMVRNMTASGSFLQSN